MREFLHAIGDSAQEVAAEPRRFDAVQPTPFLAKPGEIKVGKRARRSSRLPIVSLFPLSREVSHEDAGSPPPRSGEQKSANRTAARDDSAPPFATLWIRAHGRRATCAGVCVPPGSCSATLAHPDPDRDALHSPARDRSIVDQL